MHRAALFGGTAMAVAASLWASGAWAATATAAATADDTQPGVVGELTVVAQKREQNIESVPVAITAFSGQQRDILGIKTTQDLSNFAPGLSYFSASDEALIRGIGRNSVNLATASGVATYYNGVYYGANATIALQHDSLFIGNIEVDNGPQNTLHGSNSDGGTINYISQKPTSSFYAEGRVGVQDYGYYYGEAVVSGPINDNVRFRVGGNYSSQSGGFNHNFDGQDEGGFGPQEGGRNWEYVEAQVSANIGHLDIWAMASGGDYDTTYHTGDALGNLTDYENNSSSPLAPTSYFGLCSYNPAQVGCSGQLNTVVPGSAVAAGPVVANQFAGNNPAANNPRDFINTTSDHNTQNDDIALATTWTYHLGDADLQYTGGFQQFHYDLNFNQIYDSGLASYQLQGPAGLGNLTVFPSGEFTHFDEYDNYYSNEFDVLSTTKNKFQYILGAYQYHEHFNQPVDAFCYPNQPQLKTPETILGSLGIVTGAAAMAPANPLGCAYNSNGVISYDDYAGYAHGSYDLTPEWQVAGGVRYTYDHKYGYELERLIDFSSVAALPNANTSGAGTPAIDVTSVSTATPPSGAGPEQLLPNGNLERSLNAAWSGWTGDATINWKPDSTTLAYFRYARGYKSGGLDAGAFAAVPTTAPESVDDFELGLKKTVGSMLTVNADVFYYNWQNDQQPIGVLSNGVVVNEIFNVPQSRIDGFEMLATWRPIEPLSFTVNYAYLDATITKAPCVVNSADPLALEQPAARKAGCPLTGGDQTFSLVGNTLPFSPKNKVSLNAQYTFKFEPGSLVLSASYEWKQATYDTLFDEPQDLAPVYSDVGLRAYWTDASNRYTLIAYVDNLFDNLNVDTQQLENLGGGTAATFSPIALRSFTYPRNFGLELQIRWK
jgi:iron complex outermembrane receptor protein